MSEKRIAMTHEKEKTPCDYCSCSECERCIGYDLWQPYKRFTLYYPLVNFVKLTAAWFNPKQATSITDKRMLAIARDLIAKSKEN